MRMTWPTGAVFAYWQWHKNLLAADGVEANTHRHILGHRNADRRRRIGRRGRSADTKRSVGHSCFWHRLHAAAAAASEWCGVDAPAGIRLSCCRSLHPNHCCCCCCCCWWYQSTSARRSLTLSAKPQLACVDVAFSRSLRLGAERTASSRRSAARPDRRRILTIASDAGRSPQDVRQNCVLTAIRNPWRTSGAAGCRPRDDGGVSRLWNV